MALDKPAKFTTFVRLGFAARGLTYALLGYLALGKAGEARNGATSVYDYLQDVPLGVALLWVITVGLIGYALFKFLSAFADIQNRGNDAEGRARRVGDAASGLAYSFLAYAAVKFATGRQHSPTQGESQQMAGSVLNWEIGPVLIGIVGIGLLAAAVVQAKSSVTADFMSRVSGRAPAAIKTIGRVGHAARAVVFALIGWSLVQSAWLASSGKVKGLGEALLALRDLGLAYTLVAFGLLLFGIFSMVVSRYQIIPEVSRSDLRPKL